jgi:transcriptional regulator GlxA family with amidase domain
MARVFKAQIGVSPAVYLRRRRLERTIDLVRTTRLSIREIADLVGYRDVGALDHAWRRRFASPPSEWRQQQANQG